MVTDREDGEGLTYAESGVDIAASESATGALLSAIDADSVGDYAGILDIGDRLLGITTDGVGTKSLVAEAVGDFSTIGIDCIAMNVNDLVASGIEPIAFVDYLAVEEPDDAIAEAIGQGLDTGATTAGIHLAGGETAVMPEVISGLDLAGAAIGVAGHDTVLPGEATPGDRLVGFPSSGIHSNGLTLARAAVTREHSYSDPFPGDRTKSIGAELLEPTAIYTHLLEPMRAANAHAAAHITGGGWTNLDRLGRHRYEITDPFEPQSIFSFVQDAGGISDREMYRTFNMGTGFVVALPDDRAEILLAETDGRIIGTVSSGTGISVDGLDLEPADSAG